MMREKITLDDKYTLDHGRVFLTGTQALTRLPMLQRDRDVAAGLNTAGYVSGYRGSPLGGLDHETLAKVMLEAMASYKERPDVRARPEVVDGRVRHPWILGLLTCVEGVKAVLGIRRPWILTPWQLARHLRRQQWVS